MNHIAGSGQGIWKKIFRKLDPQSAREPVCEKCDKYLYWKRKPVFAKKAQGRAFFKDNVAKAGLCDVISISD